MGGDQIVKAEIVDDSILQKVDYLSLMAPLHNPANLLGIKKMQELIKSPNVVVCDTAFHSTIEEQKFLYPLPYELYTKDKIRKYGAHGTSCEFNVKKFEKEENIKNPNLIILHLGNGSSVTAIKDGKSANTTMGFTPLAGLMMGTRCGNIDPAVGIFMQRELKMSFDEVENTFNKKSGLLGISKNTSDMRDIVSKMSMGDKNATLAFEMFTDRVANYYSQYLNELDGKIDGLIFTAGIGYNSKDVVDSIISKIKISKLKLQENWKNNRTGWQLISSKDSQFPIFISETNEEIEIAEQSLAAIGRR